MNALAIILARGGSKRIPRKNIRSFHGRPILAYPIKAALGSGCFEEIMVSTEDPEIAAVARECGAEVPFMRSERTATDFAGSEEVMAEVIRNYRAKGRHFTEVCAIYATAALTTADHIRRGRDVLAADGGLTAVLPVIRYSFPIQRSIVLRDGRVAMLHPEHLDTRSQDLEPAYHDAGQWYWLRSERFLPSLELMGPNCGALVLPENEAQDIDQEDDWLLAELKHQLLLAKTP